MTSRERVRRCLEFDCPDRVPRDLWLLPAAHLEHGAETVRGLQRRWPSDFTGVPVGNPALAALRRGDPYEPGAFTDEWGCTFENLHPGVIGEVKEPFLSDWSKMEDLRVPEEALSVDVEAVNAFCADSDRFVAGNCCPRPFERAQFLRGSENLYLDLGLDPPELHTLLQTLHEFYCRELEVWVRSDIDRITFMDDWGTQSALLISPAQWRRLFKPLYADYVRIAHEHGKKAFMHSDGHIFDIYEDLIDIGVDAVNSQLFCMDIERIGALFAGRITFWGEIDRQYVLANGTPRECREAVARVVRSLYRPEGGVIAQFEFGPGHRPDNADAVFRAWEELTRTVGAEGD